MIESEKIAEATLYYLYMMADGEVTYSEEKIFSEICKEMQLTGETKREIVSECKSKVKKIWGVSQ